MTPATCRPRGSHAPTETRNEPHQSPEDQFLEAVIIISGKTNDTENIANHICRSVSELIMCSLQIGVHHIPVSRFEFANGLSL